MKKPIEILEPFIFSPDDFFNVIRPSDAISAMESYAQQKALQLIEELEQTYAAIPVESEYMQGAAHGLHIAIQKIKTIFKLP